MQDATNGDCALTRRGSFTQSGSPSIDCGDVSAPYVVITPVRDEAQLVQVTIDSVVGQTSRPRQWVIVDDGSSDGTGAILDRAAASVDWIKVVHRSDRGARVAGSGVIEAFYAGLEALTVGDWRYLVKLDGDLRLPPTYFASCLRRFELDPQLGIGGGLVVDDRRGRRYLERHPRFHVRGATKIYDRRCWGDIGGVVRAPGWDTLDEVAANLRGWRTETFEDVELLQLRQTGGPVGRWADVAKNGRASYMLGYHPAFVAVRALRKLRQRPYGITSLALLYGYTRAVLESAEPIGDREVRQYVREQQLRRLTLRSTIWR
ncbi:MAG: glycosyltransferase [Acidimicrobiia bacterium]|nr:glycosyltransferase [Acidimicrobiia bacterium]